MSRNSSSELVCGTSDFTFDRQNSDLVFCYVDFVREAAVGAWHAYETGFDHTEGRRDTAVAIGHDRGTSRRAWLARDTHEAARDIDPVGLRRETDSNGGAHRGEQDRRPRCFALVGEPPRNTLGPIQRHMLRLRERATCEPT